MIISVRFLDSAKTYAYECPFPVRINDLVTVPPSWYASDPRQGLVVELNPTLTFDGPLKTVLDWIPWEGNEA